MKILGAVMATLAVFIFAAIYSGYVFSLLWGWFVVPIFGLPALSIPYAIGIGLIVSFLSKDAEAASEGISFYEALTKAFFISLFKPSAAVAMGWVVLKFV